MPCILCNDWGGESCKRLRIKRYTEEKRVTQWRAALHQALLVTETFDEVSLINEA